MLGIGANIHLNEHMLTVSSTVVHPVIKFIITGVIFNSIKLIGILFFRCLMIAAHSFAPR